MPLRPSPLGLATSALAQAPAAIRGPHLTCPPLSVTSQVVIHSGRYRYLIRKMPLIPETLPLLCRPSLRPCSNSPISLQLTMHSMRTGARKDLAGVLASDFRGVCHCTRRGWDFWEGVQARLGDRRAPRWLHATPADVPCSYAAAAFGPLEFCAELDLSAVDRLFDRRAPEPHARL